jgi:hypothetical protein
MFACSYPEMKKRRQQTHDGQRRNSPIRSSLDEVVFPVLNERRAPPPQLRESSRQRGV